MDQPWTVFPEEGCAGAGRRPLPRGDQAGLQGCANRLTVDKAWRADDAEALRRLYRRACSLVDPRILMVQQLVAGNGDSQLSYAALCSNGRWWRRSPRAACVSTRWTSGGRARTSRRSTTGTGARRPGCSRRCASPGWSRSSSSATRSPGPTSCSTSTREPGAGSRSAAEPASTSRTCSGGSLTGESVPRTQAAPGVRWVRAGTDLLAAAGELAAGRLSVRDYARSLRAPLEFAVFAPDDPLPSLAGPLLTARFVASRLAAGRPV